MYHYGKRGQTEEWVLGHQSLPDSVSPRSLLRLSSEPYQNPTSKGTRKRKPQKTSVVCVDKHETAVGSRVDSALQLQSVIQMSP